MATSNTYLLLLFSFIWTVAAKPVSNDNSEGQNRAGLTDILNPQNLPNAGLNVINGNPVQSILNRTDTQNDLLKEVKLLFLTVQGAFMPASVITGGLNSFAQGLGNMGNMFGGLGGSLQGLNPLPS